MGRKWREIDSGFWAFFCAWGTGHRSLAVFPTARPVLAEMHEPATREMRKLRERERKGRRMDDKLKKEKETEAYE